MNLEKDALNVVPASRKINDFATMIQQMQIGFGMNNGRRAYRITPGEAVEKFMGMTPKVYEDYISKHYRR
jgi:hypothetical protein